METHSYFGRKVQGCDRCFNLMQLGTSSYRLMREYRHQNQECDRLRTATSGGKLVFTIFGAISNPILWQRTFPIPIGTYFSATQ
ncbi:hypothetical protein NDA03_27405 [Trichocoleus sp. Lan]|uniref:hypothetical protein n=1 Tax=Trichocoleus sp. Lan TaxID=2933927 RepID=UPI003299E4D8